MTWVFYSSAGDLFFRSHTTKETKLTCELSQVLKNHGDLLSLVTFWRRMSVIMMPHLCSVLLGKLFLHEAVDQLSKRNRARSSLKV